MMAGQKNIIKAYYLLTKPGIIYSNAVTAIGGFFLAAKGHSDVRLFLAMVFGLSFGIASACVYNNYIDRDIDAKMKRTKKRALVQKSISGRNALVFATVLGIASFVLLVFYVNLLSAFVMFVGFFFYVVMYSIWKRRSEIGTIVGSISGAVPPVVGYCAVTNHFDVAALLLFLILVFWQMPHFYAISIFRYDDYVSAGIPVLPIKKGLSQTKIQMIFYMIAFIIAAALLTVFHYTGYVYLVIMTVLGIVWLVITLKGFTTTDVNRWARKVFFFSLLIIVTFAFLLSISKILP